MLRIALETVLGRLHQDPGRAFVQDELTGRLFAEGQQSDIEPNRREIIKGAVAVAAIGDVPMQSALARTEVNPMPLDNLEYRSATELLAALAGKRISSAELVDFSISRIEALDTNINAVVVRDFERARGAALAADSALARGEARPSLGLPMTVKEMFNMAQHCYAYRAAGYHGTDRS